MSLPGAITFGVPACSVNWLRQAVCYRRRLTSCDVLGNLLARAIGGRRGGRGSAMFEATCRRLAMLLFALMPGGVVCVGCRWIIC